jgi:hypothetical protein
MPQTTYGNQFLTVAPAGAAVTFAGRPQAW